MPAKTPAQRRLFGAALAAKRGAKPISKRVADIAAKTSEKELSKMASKTKKKMKKEGIEGALDTVYAVQKPYSGCQLTSLVKPIDPLVGLEGSEVVRDAVHAVYPDQQMAQSVAQKLYEEFQAQQEALQHKKIQVIEKTKKTMNLLEKRRKSYMEMMKENPGNINEYRQKVAELATKIDELVSTLERVEKSRKLYEVDEEQPKKKFTYKDVASKQEVEIEAKDEKEAKAIVVKKGGDITTVKEKPEPEPAPETAEKPAEEQPKEEK